MSQENVDRLRSAIGSYLASGQLDALEALADPAVELHGAVGGLEEGSVVRGVQRVADGLRVDSEVWAARHFEIQRFVDAGEQVVVFVTEHRRGRGSDVDTRADVATIYSFAAGRIVRIEPYMDPEQALEAVGLRE